MDSVEMLCGNNTVCNADMSDICLIRIHSAVQRRRSCCDKPCRHSRSRIDAAGSFRSTDLRWCSRHQGQVCIIYRCSFFSRQHLFLFLASYCHNSVL